MFAISGSESTGKGCVSRGNAQPGRPCSLFWTGACSYRIHGYSTAPVMGKGPGVCRRQNRTFCACDKFDKLAKTQNPEHLPLGFQQVIRPAGYFLFGRCIGTGGVPAHVFDDQPAVLLQEAVIRGGIAGVDDTVQSDNAFDPCQDHDFLA